MSHLQKFIDKNLAHPPKPVTNGTLVYEVIMGSRAYGCNSPNSDYDIYGICVPPVGYIFNHLMGVVPGFGTNNYVFSHYEQQHLMDGSGKEHSFAIYSIVRAFDLLLGCNPNVVEILFAPQVNITSIGKIGHLIRDNRHSFLSKLYVNKMRAYAISQMKKARDRKPIGKRVELVDKYGFDTKSAMNLIRLAFQVEQVLLEKDLDLQRNATTLLAIRNGEWTLDKIEEIFNNKQIEIEKLILTSDLQAKPDENKIKELLLECLEIQYGKITDKIIIESPVVETLKQIHALAEKALGK